MQAIIEKFNAIPREVITPMAHPAMRADVCKWICTDGKTWRAGDKATATWFNCANESEADEVAASMSGLTAPQIKAA